MDKYRYKYFDLIGQIDVVEATTLDEAMEKFRPNHAWKFMYVFPFMAIVEVEDVTYGVRWDKVS